MKKDSKLMSWAMGVIAGVGHIFGPKISRARIEHIGSIVDAARTESTHLADKLNEIADTQADPFKEFAHRANQSRFKKFIREGGN